MDPNKEAVLLHADKQGGRDRAGLTGKFPLGSSLHPFLWREEATVDIVCIQCQHLHVGPSFVTALIPRVGVGLCHFLETVTFWLLI